MVYMYVITDRISLTIIPCVELLPQYAGTFSIGNKRHCCLFVFKMIGIVALVVYKTSTNLKSLCKKESCVGRESNPDLLLGRQQC